MSRRCHHGSPRHLRQAARERRRGPALAEHPPIAPADRPFDAPADDVAEPLEAGVEQSDELAPEDGLEAQDSREAQAEAAAAAAGVAAQSDVASPAEVASPADTSLQVAPPAVVMPVPEPARRSAPPPAGPPGPAGAAHVRPRHRPREVVADADAGSGEPGLERGATAPQLRRFIKSRAYVPMHELRRRFGINGGDDDVIPIDVDRQRVYVGLPPREGSLIGELLRAGDIGYELSMDPIAPIVVGVYPMRPVPRN